MPADLTVPLGANPDPNTLAIPFGEIAVTAGTLKPRTYDAAARDRRL